MLKPRIFRAFPTNALSPPPDPAAGTVNPNAKSVKSESLSARWILEWTTEREIIFLMERGLPGKPSGPVEQDIDVDARTLSNRMIFGDDSLFEVASSIDPEVGAFWERFRRKLFVENHELFLSDSVLWAGWY